MNLIKHLFNGMRMPLNFMMILIFISILSSCNKDEEIIEPKINKDFSVENLKNITYKNKSDILSIRNSMDSIPIEHTGNYAVEPDWNIRIIMKNNIGDTVRTLVPCKVGAPFQLLGLRSTTFLQFDRVLNTNSSFISQKVVTMIPKDVDINFQRFSGVAVVHNLNNLLATTYKISNDSILASGTLDFEDIVEESSITLRDGPGRPMPCWNPDKGKFYQNVKNWLSENFGDVFGGPGGWGFNFPYLDTGDSWNNGGGSEGSGSHSGSGGPGGPGGPGNTNPGNNNPGFTIELPDAWKNKDFSLWMFFGNNTNAYDYMVNIKELAKSSNVYKHKLHRLLNFYTNLLTITPDINENLLPMTGPCPHGDCEAIDILDYALSGNPAFANQVILHFTGNTNITSMVLDSWAWK